MKKLTTTAIALAFALGGYGTVASASDVEKKMDPLPGNVGVEGHGQNPQFELGDEEKATPEDMMDAGNPDLEAKSAPLPGNVNVEGHGQNPQFDTSTGDAAGHSDVVRESAPLPGNVDVEGHGQNPQFKK